MDRKYRLKFNESNVQESVAYILVSEFQIVPNILKAEVRDDGGVLMLVMSGEEKNIDAAVEHLKGMGISVKPMEKHIDRNPDKCIDCGACVSVCPTKSFKFDPDTWEVKLSFETCIACGSCLSACPTHAIELRI